MERLSTNLAHRQGFRPVPRQKTRHLRLCFPGSARFQRAGFGILPNQIRRIAFVPIAPPSEWRPHRHDQSSDILTCGESWRDHHWWGWTAGPSDLFPRSRVAPGPIRKNVGHLRRDAPTISPIAPSPPIAPKQTGPNLEKNPIIPLTASKSPESLIT